MRKRLLLISLTVSFCTIAFAQTQNDGSEKSYKHDIGFNTTFLFDGIFNSGSGPFTLMYKQYKSENKALRLGLTTSFNFNSNNANVNTSSYTDWSYANIYFTLGKEFQHHINNKWVWYGGGDLQPHYSFNNNLYYTGTTKTTTYKDSSIGMGLRPFLGIRYNFNSRLYVSAEAGVTLDYRYVKSYAKDEVGNTVFRDTKGNNLAMALSSASGLYLFYRF
ncbi:MAG TPA: hypothetical protein VL443_11915 [Cyclobacteriaceae bacterium]|jgi:hypothetical protein|nr:hypothetical protein [Cyclobacteriaceae bacterium]